MRPCPLTAADEDDEDAFRAARAESPARSVKEAEGELEKLVRSGYRTVVAFESRGEAERARYGLDRLDARLLEGGRVSPDPGLAFAEARLREGFVSPELKLAVYPFRRLVHRRRSEEPAPAGGRGRLAFGELRVGDYVVHEDHGVARFAGFETREVGGVTRDYLYLEYKGEDRVYVPTDQLAKLSRYVGAGGEPTLSALGGKRWQNLKARARKAAGALAGELLNLYAERRARKGHAFPPDGEWQIAMETAFPYRETADQLEAIEAVKGDMESERPMDRLVCGDVGFGKTEVALRAAVKAASDGAQVMVLVPTTILAQQHYGTFRERLADLPFRVEGVSRLRPPAEVKAILKDFEAGKVDVLIGTHRLLSRDVRAKELGLVVVDEEQRFGVKQKELLRQLKLKVDVLSLSATPIPRTLQMSLAGLRDISVIETPPEGRRPVRTYVGPYDEDLVRKAVAAGDRAQGPGLRPPQPDRLAARGRPSGCAALVPGARCLEAHGQMDEHKLEETMLDLPARRGRRPGDDDDHRVRPRHPDREHADRRARRPARPLAGLPDPRPRRPLSRARLRLPALPLGRGSDRGGGGTALDPRRPHRARLRLPHRDARPRHPRRRQPARRRAVGARRRGGVRALLPDDRRGGRRGCRGRGEEEREETPEPVRLDVPVDAYLPASFVPFEAAKIDIHRRIVAAREPGQLRAIRDELSDRFGPLPPQAENLLKLQKARIELGLAGARSIEFRGGRISVTGVALDSEAAGLLAEKVEGAVYEWREQTAALRAAGDPEERLAAVLAMAEGLREARRAAEPAAA